ncbi:MAG: hypothetical protein ACTSQY_07705 [Candidatus Odinarchaeia archaeon]
MSSLFINAKTKKSNPGSYIIFNVSKLISPIGFAAKVSAIVVIALKKPDNKFSSISSVPYFL